MREFEVPVLDPAWGKRLTWHGYREDFWPRRSWAGGDSWKLERRQHFEESQPSPSRQALRDGDWNGAMRLIDAGREKHRAHAREDREHGAVFHRVRVVEEPLTPYVQWELHALRVQAETGTPVRVVNAELLRGLEPGGRLLPELVTLGGHTLYEVCYTPEGVPDGAVRFTDPAIVAAWESLMKDLYGAGEELIAYIERHVARLPPPKLAGRAG